MFTWFVVSELSVHGRVAALSWGLRQSRVSRQGACGAADCFPIAADKQRAKEGEVDVTPRFRDRLQWPACLPLAPTAQRSHHLPMVHRLLTRPVTHGLWGTFKIQTIATRSWSQQVKASLSPRANSPVGRRSIFCRC